MSAKTQCEYCEEDNVLICAECDACDDCCECRECEQCWGKIPDYDPACWDCYSCSECCRCDEACVDCGDADRETTEGEDGERRCSDCAFKEEMPCPNCKRTGISINANDITYCPHCWFQYQRDVVMEGWRLVGVSNIYLTGQNVAPPLFVSNRELEEQMPTITSFRMNGVEYVPQPTSKEPEEQMTITHKYDRDALVAELNNFVREAEAEQEAVDTANERLEQWLLDAVEEALQTGAFHTKDGRRVDAEAYSPGGRVKLVGDYAEKLAPTVISQMMKRVRERLTQLHNLADEPVELTPEEYQDWVGQYVAMLPDLRARTESLTPSA